MWLPDFPRVISCLPFCKKVFSSSTAFGDVNRLSTLLILYAKVQIFWEGHKNLQIFLNWLSQGQLQIWREHSILIFENLKPVEKSKAFGMLQPVLTDILIPTRDVSTGATGATAVTPKFWDTLTLLQPGGQILPTISEVAPKFFPWLRPCLLSINFHISTRVHMCPIQFEFIWVLIYVMEVSIDLYRDLHVYVNSCLCELMSLRICISYHVIMSTHA